MTPITVQDIATAQLSQLKEIVPKAVTGTFIHVPKGVDAGVVSMPFPSSSQWHSVIFLDEGAKATVVEKLSGNSDIASNLTIVLAKNSTLTFASLQNVAPESAVALTRNAKVADGASLTWCIATLGGNVTSDRMTTLDGPRAVVKDVELFFGAGKQKHSLKSYITHFSGSTKSEGIVRGILRDTATTIADSRVRIEHGSKQADSAVHQHILLLNPQARADAIPSLEIEESDVRATHAATVSQIDKEQLFYLQSRGMSLAEAREIISLGYLQPALAAFPESLQPLILENVQQRFGK